MKRILLSIFMLSCINSKNISTSFVKMSPEDERIKQSLLSGTGSAEEIEGLLEREEIDINEQDSFGYTPLVNAIIEDNGELAMFLLNHEQIDVNASCEDGNKPINVVLTMDDEVPRRKCLKKLIAMEADVNSLSLEDFTPLAEAVANYYIEEIEILLTSPNIDVDLGGEQRLDALTLARRMNYQEAIDLLK